MHEHCSCTYGEKSWSEDASLFNTIIVCDLTGELVVYRNSHCNVSVQALQDSNTLGGGHPICSPHNYPHSIAVHGVKRFGEVNTGYVEVAVLLSGLLHKLSDSEDHIRRATVTAKAASLLLIEPRVCVCVCVCVCAKFDQFMP